MRRLVLLCLTVLGMGCTATPTDVPPSAAVPSDLPSTPDASTEDAEATVDTRLPPSPPPPYEIGPEIFCTETRAPGQFLDRADALIPTFLHNATPTGNHEMGTFAVGAGIAAEDYDSDGHIDLYLTTIGGEDALYLTGGRGALEFERIPLPGWSADMHVGAYPGDADNDGDIDLFLTPVGVSPGLILNDGKGSFTAQGVPIQPVTGYFEQSLCWGDVDQNGSLDLLVAGGPSVSTVDEAAPGGPTRLFRQVDSLAYAELPIPLPSAHGQTFLAGFVDYDNDGDSDIYVVNDFGMTVQPNRLLRNDGDAGFVDVSFESDADIAVWGMGLAVGDANLDGWLDLFVANMDPMDDVLLINEHDGGFRDDTHDWNASSIDVSPGVAWGAIFIDVEGDGDEDIFVTHGAHNGLIVSETSNASKQPNVLLLNQLGTFEDGTQTANVAGDASSRSPVEADLNADGFPDLLVGNLDAAPYIYINGCSSEKNWIGVRFPGFPGYRSPLGARITVRVGDRIHIREIGSGNDGLYGAGPSSVTIGLGDTTQIDRLEVRWPGGDTQVLENVPGRRWISFWSPLSSSE